MASRQTKASKKRTQAGQTEAEVPDVLQTTTLFKALGWLTLVSAWLLVVASMLSFHPTDPPNPVFGLVNDPPKNWVGHMGAYLAYEVYLMLGPGAWLVVVGVSTWLFLGLRKIVVDQLLIRLVGLLVMAVSASGLLYLMMPGLMTHAGVVTPIGPGGLVALFLVDQLVMRFAELGSFIILSLLFCVGALVAADTVVFAIPRWLFMLTQRVSGIPMPRVAMNTAGGGGSRAEKTSKAKQQAEASRGFFSWLGGFGFGSGAVLEKESDSRRRKTRKPRTLSSRKLKKHDPEAWIEEDEVEVEDEAQEWEYEDQAEEDYEYVDEDGNPIDPSEIEGYDVSDEEGELAEDEQEADEWEYEEEGEYDEAEEDGEEGGGEGAPAAYLAEREFTPDELRDKIAKLPINFAPKKSLQNELPREVDLSGYQFPSFDLLDETEEDAGEQRLALVREQGAVLEAALKEYGIDGEVAGIDSGPTITMYEVRLAPGTKVASLNRVSSDLARSLKAQNIRVVPNMEGKDTIGIEVPNLEREKVALRELMASSGNTSSKMVLPMWLGKDASGDAMLFDLNSMPHMLIAGTTGSGKSVCMNAIIMSLLFTKRPDELKLVLVDPKMVEMAMYKDIPHLMCPVVTEMSKAAAILEWAVTKMDERYELLAEAGVRNIQTYNELGEEKLKERLDPNSEEEWARIPKKLPYIVFIIDELADLMMTNKEVEAHIVRIAQKARAVGMHLILATQRPQANVVTGLIKGNMPCRVSFRVASKLDSRIVLDSSGAELLLGHGDMLFLNPKTSKVSRCQGAFIDDLEIRRTVKFLKSVAAQSFEPSLVQIKGKTEMEGLEERDDLFDKAVEVVLETQRGSVSLLQRKLTIGYSRASRMIEQMEAAGILGGHKNAQAREVLIGLNEWEAIKAQMNADSQGDENLFESASDDATDESVPEEYGDEYRQ